MERQDRFGHRLALCGLLYAALMVTVVWSMFAARDWALSSLATQQSITDWEEWRDEVRAQQDRPVPVQRRVPKTAEPPALVLMRDFFGVSLSGAILFSSVLFWVMAWLVTGIMTKTALDEERAAQ